jgi:hypothetical protein
MSELNELSPYVRSVLIENNLEPIQVLRYGPRFVGIVVERDGVEGFFKMVLPLEERQLLASSDYIWTEYDEGPRLERRLIKEALFLQFFAQKLANHSFQPDIITLSETSPVWSLRTYIHERTMSAWNSDFVFSPRFFETFTPREAIDFFVRMHDLTPEIPNNLQAIVAEFVSTLQNPNRFSRSVDRMREIPAFLEYATHIEERFSSAEARYADYRRVITHYEPYPPHIFASKGEMGLIDWENVGWGHQLQDLSVLYMRCAARPDWQAEYIAILEEYGYFSGNGRLFWESELLIQALANHRWFEEGGPIGTPEYDQHALAFFESTISEILTKSEYFKA